MNEVQDIRTYEPLKEKGLSPELVDILILTRKGIIEVLDDEKVGLMDKLVPIQAIGVKSRIY